MIADSVKEPLISDLSRASSWCGGDRPARSTRDQTVIPVPGRAVRSQHARKGGRAVKWLVLYATGHKQTLSLDRRQLIQHFNLDIPVRDMRLLDPSLLAGGAAGGAQQSGQVLVRDNAILVAMEFVRIIITADKAIMPLEDERGELVDRWVANLEVKVHERVTDGYGSLPPMGPAFANVLAQHHPHSHPQHLNVLVPHPDMFQDHESMRGQSGGSSMHGGTGGGAAGHGATGVHRPSAYPRRVDGLDHRDHDHGSEYGEHGGGMDAASQRGVEELPFELHVLEAGLGEACTYLQREVSHLQELAEPALNDLISSSDRRNLERVRRVKTQHQRLIGRVAVIRDSLQRIMEDDSDMVRMCLSRSSQARKPSTAFMPANSVNQVGGLLWPAPCSVASPFTSASQPIPGGQPRPSSEPPQTPTFPQHGSSRQIIDLPEHSSLHIQGGGSSLRSTPSILAIKMRHAQQVAQAAAAAAAAKVDSRQIPETALQPALSASLDEDGLHEVLDVENLLEAYFMQAESIHSALVNLGEYITDTEDLVNLQLDYNRNRLIKFEVVLTTGTFALAFMACVAGVLGENLVLPKIFTQDLAGFFIINFGVALISASFFLVTYMCLRKRKML